ncbi:MAG: hypothetical protein V4620_03875 [Bacteroidota bacterium]
MKKLIILITLLVSFSSTFSQLPCVTFHRTLYCYKEFDGDWIYNSQSKSGYFKEGVVSRVRCVVYNGFDYRISVCDEGTFEKPPIYKIFDSPTGELIVDSETLQTKEFIFRSTDSRTLTIEVEVPKGKKGYTKRKPSGTECIGLMIFQRVTIQP